MGIPHDMKPNGAFFSLQDSKLIDQIDVYGIRYASSTKQNTMYHKRSWMAWRQLFAL